MKIIMAGNGSTVAEHLPHHLKVKGSSPTRTWIEEMAKRIIVMITNNGNSVVEQSPHHQKVERKVFKNTIALVLF